MRISTAVTAASAFLAAISVSTPASTTDAAESKASKTTDGKTVRDHRGSNGAAQGGVTVGQGKTKRPTRVTQSPGPLGGPKNKQGFAGLNGSGEKGHSGGPTIRDHRNGK
jgi:uncharacterized protein with beta-barrel porin domain